MNLRPYQRRTVDEILPDLWRRGVSSVIVCAPVGSGKTVIATELARRTVEAGRSDLYFLAHRSELIEQPHHRFTAAGIAHGVVQASRPTAPDQRVQVASVQTVGRRGQRVIRGGESCIVVVDEGHRCRAETYERIIAWFCSAYRRVYLILLTATPYRLDGKPLGDVAQALVEIATPRQLIAEGYICNPTVYAGAQPDVRGVHRRAGDFVPEELEARACAPRLVADIVKTWKDKAEGLPTVGFALSIAHSQHLVERFRAAGVRAAHVDGTTPTAERSRTLARLAIGGLASSHPEALDIVINVGILVEGWDSESDYQRVLSDPSLWVDSEGRLTSYPPQYRPLCVLGDYAPTLSMCAYRQREGRVCRTHHDKSRAIVLSHSGNVVDDRGRVRHGWLEQHEGFSLETGMPVNAPETSLEGAKRLTPISPAYCPACMAVWPPGTRICGACGVEMVGQGGDDQVWREKAGELREVKPTSTERPATPYEQLTYLIQQYRTAQASGYKDFWAWKRYELRFGRMPDFGTDARARGEVGLPPRQRKGAKA